MLDVALSLPWVQIEGGLAFATYQHTELYLDKRDRTKSISLLHGNKVVCNMRLM